MNNLHRILYAFLVGMLFEYLLRVEVSFLPLALFILLTITLIFDFLLSNISTKHKEKNGNIYSTKFVKYKKSINFVAW